MLKASSLKLQSIRLLAHGRRQDIVYIVAVLSRTSMVEPPAMFDVGLCSAAIPDTCLPARSTRAEGSVIDCDGYVGISGQLDAHLLCVHTRGWRSRCAKVKCSVESEDTLVLFDLTTKSAKKLLGVPPAPMGLGPCSAALQETAALVRSVV